MSDLVLSTGEVVPELAETVTVLEDGSMVLFRVVSGYLLTKRVYVPEWGHHHFLPQGRIERFDSVWRAWTVDGLDYATCDLDQAIGALWASRKASQEAS